MKRQRRMQGNNGEPWIVALPCPPRPETNDVCAEKESRRGLMLFEWCATSTLAEVRRAATWSAKYGWIHGEDINFSFPSISNQEWYFQSSFWMRKNPSFPRWRRSSRFLDIPRSWLPWASAGRRGEKRKGRFLKAKKGEPPKSGDS